MPLLSLVCSGKKIGVENCASESGNHVSMCACLCKEQVRGADGEGGGEVDVALIPAALQHLRHAPHPTAAADSGKSEGHEGAKRRPLRRPPRAIQRRRRVWEAAVGVQCPMGCRTRPGQPALLCCHLNRKEINAGMYEIEFPIRFLYVCHRRHRSLERGHNG